MVCRNVIGVRARHVFDNRLVDVREHRVREWITWVSRLGDRGEEGVVSLLYITSGRAPTVVMVEIARRHCCRCEKDFWNGNCEPGKYRIWG